MGRRGHFFCVTDVTNVTRNGGWAIFTSTASHVLLDFSLELQRKVGVGNFL
nr:MAG TPA: hypothetical protein [Caudoviricetes sp.]